MKKMASNIPFLPNTHMISITIQDTAPSLTILFV